VFVVVLDQATKLFVKGFTLPFFHHEGLQLGTSVPMLGDALRLTYIENPGMAFGIELGSQLYLAIFSLLASLGVLYYLHKVRDELLVIRVSLALILGGAIGNLIDRVFYGVIFDEAPLFYGKVVDFIDVNFLHLSRFGIFNVADAAVTTGVVLLLVFHRKAEMPKTQTVGSGETSTEKTWTEGDKAGERRAAEGPLDVEEVRKKQS
jgi:signal peptidase II